MASGISSSAVGTMAGQMIMQGFVRFHIPIWVRRLVTMLPASAVVLAGAKTTDALVYTQVVLGEFFSDCTAFFAANLVKVLQGGWIPLMLAGISMLLMSTWVRGMAFLAEKTRREAIPTHDFLKLLEKSKPARVPGTAIFLTGDPAFAPRGLMHNLKHNKVLHERIIFMNVKTENMPRVPAGHRFETQELSTDFIGVTVHYGYMESPRVPAVLALLRKNGMKLEIMNTSFFVGRRALKRSPKSRMPVWQDSLFIALSKQASNATDYFSIPSDRVVELGAQVTI